VTSPTQSKKSVESTV